MDRTIKAGFLSIQNYLDKNAFSGTLYYMYHALKSRGIEVVDLKRPQAHSWIGRKVNRVFNRVCFGSAEGNLNKTAFKRQVQKILENEACDLIIAPVASDEVDLVETSIPIIFVSDATPKLVHNKYYNLYFDNTKFAAASKQEERVLSKARKIIYPSRWSAKSAIRDYGVDPAKISILPFGANLDFAPKIDEIRARLMLSGCKLLFIGKDWHRKGGDIAYETLKALLDLGIDAELTMIGCTLPKDLSARVGKERLTMIPFLNKNTKRERDRLHQILLDAHFFLLPTRADCSPIVLCEAAAFGLPVLSSRVGGIQTIVEEGVNGYTFSDSSDARAYAETIAAVFSDQSRYERLVLSSRQTYEDRLNWKAWADGIYDVMLEVLATNSSKTLTKA